ncbi:MAG TPA: HBL/NHE enterotoxin family protein [Pyrinomonadaceae bacterium]|nr:HBL/NHE enterotoxin family protein [Pyrinomonadaceae bacterium]
MTVQLAVDLTDQQNKLAGYINAKANVAKYVAALQNTDISGVNFKTLPSDIQSKLPADPAVLLQTVNANLTTAKQHGQFWSNTIQPGLTSIPQAIINFNSQFQAEMALILPLVQSLLVTPDPDKRTELVELFNGLLGKIKEQTDAIATEITNLQTFNTEVTGDHGNFSSGNNQFAAIQQFEQSNITALNTAIKGLDDTISTLNTAITAESVAVGASVALIVGGGIGMASAETGVGAVVGCICLVVGMIGLGVAVGELISSIEQKQEAQQKEAFDQLEVSLLTVQVQALNTAESALGTLVTQSQLAMQSVQVILDTWATLSAKISAVVTDLNDSEKAIGDIMSLVDLQTAQTQWNQLETFAGQMQDFEQSLFAQPPVVAKLSPMNVTIPASASAV